MKKILTVLMMVLIMVGLISCVTTSGIDTNDIKENKLTSVSYLKKICDVKLVYSEKGDEVYLLDDGKGYFFHKKNSHKICLIVKDGYLYGRSESYLDYNITVTFNLHDSKCKQSYSADSAGAYWYYTEEALDEMTEHIIDGMIDLLKECGLEKYINTIEYSLYTI